jgi:hypothetical protein
MTRKEIIIRNAAAHLRRKMRDMLRVSAKVAAKRNYPGVSNYPAETFAACIDAVCYGLKVQINVECEHIKSSKGNYEPLFSIPPARRATQPVAKPLTLVEKRALAAKKKVREWQRKQKLAATKVKQYRKKVSYYTKKGVIQ